MFIYVFSENDAYTLGEMGLSLINYDYQNNIYIFEKPKEDIEIPCRHVIGSTMTFSL